jgi:hypothetical protein
MAITVTGNTRVGGPAVHIVLDPKATFLRTNLDAGATNAVAIDLAALGIAPDDVISIEKTGDYDADGAAVGQTDSSTGMIAVFSTSSTMFSGANLNRVPGAVSAIYASGYTTNSFTSLPTGTGGLATDIPQDFEVFGTTLMQVPVAATQLFPSAQDSSLSAEVLMSMSIRVAMVFQKVAALALGFTAVPREL